jgi:DNA-binding winged helix-turn-helix (wHTH) protein
LLLPALLVFRLVPFLHRHYTDLWDTALPWRSIRTAATDFGPLHSIDELATNTCPACYYTFYTRYFGVPVTRPSRRYTKGEITASIDAARLETDPTVRWALLSHCLTLEGATNYELGRCFLRGSWAVWKKEASDSLRNLARTHFERVAEHESATEKERTLATYLCGELSRQSRAFDDAVEWFEKYQRYAAQLGKHRFDGVDVLLLSKHQMRLAMEKIGRRIEIPELKKFRRTGKTFAPATDEDASETAVITKSYAGQTVKLKVDKANHMETAPLPRQVPPTSSIVLPPVFITGDIKKKRRNLLIIGPKKTFVTERPFELLVALIVRHFTNPLAIVPVDQLVELCHLEQDTVYQAIQRLRSQFEPAMPYEHTKQLIENVEEEGYRLNPRAIITYDKTKLLKHPNGQVQLLALQLPDSAPTTAVDRH